jgi:CheY-like chemotaxis protein
LDDGQEVSIRFSVRDTGIGISEKQQDKIFEAFAQADVSTTRQYGGTGLGLSISSKLVSLMGGKLELDSIEGKGSIFYFTLPFAHKKDAERKAFRLKGVRAGMLLPRRDINRFVDALWMNALKHMDVDASLYYENEIDRIPPKELPDVLFVDQRYCQRKGELEKILKFQTKIILIAGGNLSLASIREQLQDVIYKPVNYTKIEHAMQRFVGKERDKPKELPVRVSRFDGVQILVAEDNTINQKLIRTTLENFGIDVTLAANGKEAIALRMEREFDLIFMDIQMPVMNGTEATEAILAYEKEHHAKHVPIVALTANALKGDREKYLDAGMDDYTPKPLEIDSIREIIRHYCPDKETFVTVGDTTEPKKEASISPLKTEPPKKKIVLYFTNSLVRSIHQHLLEPIVECIFVDSEMEMLEELDEENKSIVVIDSALLPRDHCYFADLLADEKKEIYVFGEKKRVACSSVNVYETIRGFRNILKAQIQE